MKTPSIEALEMAAEWLDCYSPGPMDENGPGMAAVAAWLRAAAKAKAVKEAEAQAIRQFAADKGVSVARVRSALAKTRKARKAA